MKYTVELEDIVGPMTVIVEADDHPTAVLRAGMALVIASIDGTDLSVPLDTVGDPEWDANSVPNGLPIVTQVIGEV